MPATMAAKPDRTEPDARTHRREDDQGQADDSRGDANDDASSTSPRDFVFSIRDANRGSSA